MLSIWMLIALWIVSLAIGFGVFMTVDFWDEWKNLVAGSAVFVVLFFFSSFLVIETENNDSRRFVNAFNAQKQTIEQSLRNDKLTGLERVELVKQASELNAELAERKTNIEHWMYFFVDDAIYDGVEYILLEV